MMKRLSFLAALLLSILAASPAFADTFRHKGVEHSYYYYESEAMLSQRPLILLLHGYGGSADNYCPKMVQTALDAGYAVCVPQGEKDPKGRPSWNVGYPSQEGWEMDDVDYLCTLATHIADSHGLNKDNIFVVGMSNGGEMCYLLAHERPDFFAAFAPIAGLTMQWMKDSLTIKKPVSLMEVHGTADMTSMWEGDPENTGGWGAYIPVYEAVKRWADAAVCRGEQIKTMKDSVVLHEFVRPNYDVEVLLYEVKGGNHSWSMDRMDTPGEVITFFNRHLSTPYTSICGTYTINDKYPDVCITVDAPEMLDPSKKTEMIFYTLPNANTIEWTAGKYTTADDDWHFNIQHIAAQTKFLRATNPDKNIITVYLADRMRSWTTWRYRYADILPKTLPAIIDDISGIYEEYDPSITLSSHSGGGYFLFEYIRTVEPMNPRIKRFVFLDSAYGYLEEVHCDKLTRWLKDKGHYLSVISYEDCNVIYDGKPLVTKEGGTWGRSHAMIRDLSKTYKIKKQQDGDWEIWRGLNGRITLKLLQNPDGKIFHTVLVEKNGFIDSYLSGTPKEGEGYQFWGERAYTPFICDAGCNTVQVREAGLKPLPYFQEHKGSGLKAWDYIESIDTLDFWSFEKKTEEALLNGDVPDSLRWFKKIRYERLGHVIEFWTLPDYLAIGTNDDFVRIPMGIISSKKVAEALGCTLPTTFLVDRINDVAEGALDIFPFRPLGSRNQLPIVFQDHNNALKALYKAKGYHYGQFISGLKKDLVLTWYQDRTPAYANNIAIYGWHHPDGHAQQPLFLRHGDFYSDYSHGTRLIWKEILVDGKPYDLEKVLHDPQLFRLVSDETQPLSK
jgi:Poly(3-hydroxybutyrate) depolymerase